MSMFSWPAPAAPGPLRPQNVRVPSPVPFESNSYQPQKPPTPPNSSQRLGVGPLQLNEKPTCHWARLPYAPAGLANAAATTAAAATASNSAIRFIDLPLPSGVVDGRLPSRGCGRPSGTRPSLSRSDAGVERDQAA